MKMHPLVTVPLAVLACTNAHADVKVYGIADAGLAYQSGSLAPSSRTSLQGGGQSGSRLGFIGSEDLGGGLKAIFNIEMGLNIDNGSLAQNGLAWGREAHVGLTGPFGRVSLGRQHTPFFRFVSNRFDPFVNGMMGSSSNLHNKYARLDNSILYSTPSINGFTGSVMYAFGETNLGSSAGRSFTATLHTEHGPLRTGLGIYNGNNAAGTATNKGTMLAASYDFGSFILFGDTERVRSTRNLVPGVTKTDTNGDIYAVGLRAPIGPHTIYGAYTLWRDKRTVGNTGAKATHVGLGYTYNLSKRTNIYTSIGGIQNKDGAQFQIMNPSSGAYGTRGFDLGIRHRF